MRKDKESKLTDCRPLIVSVSFLNTAPLVEKFSKGKKAPFRVEYAVPSLCAEEVRSRRAVAGLLPSIDYARIQGLEICSHFCIASNGSVRSVLLVSNQKWEDLRTIFLDSSSHTSVVLLKILTFHQWGKTPRIKFRFKPSLILGKNEGMLVIGDEALRMNRKDFKYRYDLGMEWKKWTNLPFVYAFWAAWKEQATPELFRFLQKGACLARSERSAMARRLAPSLSLSPSFLSAYLTRNIRYRFDCRAREGLRRFYKEALRWKLISKLPTLIEG